MYTIACLLLLAIAVLLQAFIYTNEWSWRHGRALSVIGSGVLTASALCMLMVSTVVGSVFAFVIAYNVFSMFRIIKSRLPDARLRQTTRRTSRVLTYVLLALVVLHVLLTFGYIILSWHDALIVVMAGSVAFSAVIAISTTLNIIASKPIKTQALSDNELPTISIAISARNETPKLTACLESLLSSDYPKMEILVLDDESQDSTAEIIKSFAQDGVRFVQSETFNGTWLAKNRAYQTLLTHASGEYIMYMGVDVRVREQSVRRIAEQVVASDHAMTTLVPKRTKSGLAAVLVQPLRYWWELAIPQVLSRRPPALSTAWIIKRQAMLALGGFSAYKKSIIPEMHLSKYYSLIKSYSFIRTTKDMVITTHKDLSSQWDTLIRTRYPLVHRRPEEVLLQTGAIFLFVITPFLLLVSMLFIDMPQTVAALIVTSVVLYIYSHVAISFITNPIAGYLAPLNFPAEMTLDIVGMHLSMYRYEFSKVVWKGRDVAPKKLEVIHKLPDIDNVSSLNQESTR